MSLPLDYPDSEVPSTILIVTKVSCIIVVIVVTFSIFQTCAKTFAREHFCSEWLRSNLISAFTVVNLYHVTDSKA